ncbi:unnamed protein product [Rhizophagus irregularis]|nr:unnamed protein product [Rhizophagus irregularis]
MKIYVIQLEANLNWFFNYDRYYYKSPSTNYTEVSCNNLNQVVCHDERLGGNDEWCIELIKQHIWTIDTLHD